MNNPQENYFRSLPQAVESERALLSSMLQNNALVEDFAWLDIDHFYMPSHQIIFRRLREMRESGKLCDFITLTQTLDDQKELEEAGGAAAVTDIFTLVPTATNAAYYAEQVREKYIRRRIIGKCAELVQNAYDDTRPPEQLLEDTESSLLALRPSTAGDAAMQHIKPAVQGALDQIEATYANRGKPSGAASGLNDLDRMTGGFKPGQLIIVGARPGMGKTALAMQSAVNFAQKEPGLIISMEMNAIELASRAMCSGAPMNLQRIRDGMMGEGDLNKLTSSAQQLSNLPIYIDETPALTIFEFRARARRAAVKHGIKWIVVDYLQLMRSTSKRASESRAIEVAEISMALKACAKELKIPVIALAQLNRDAEQRSGPPKLSDLRESGQIEQDADIIMFIHRPHKDSEDLAEKQKALLVVAKHRDGPVNTITLRFEGEYAKFHNVTQELYSNNDEKRQH